MFNLEFDGEIYRYAFSKPDGVLSWEDREYLLRETVRLDRKGDKKTDVRGDVFEGKIERGEFCSFGNCCGREYTSELETEKGKRYAKILILKSHSPKMN